MALSRKPLTHVARRLRRDSTDAEIRFWRALRDEPFKSAHFRRQVPLGSFVVDFASHKARLVIELDGGQHADLTNMLADSTRDAALKDAGYRVLRFWNGDLFHNLDGVLDTVAAALYDAFALNGDGAAVTPTPDPSPQGGGG